MTEPTRATYSPEHLAIIRSQLGLSLRDFAHLAGVNERRVRAWFAGESVPSPAAAQKITVAHEQFQAQVSRHTSQLLRSRTRPVEVRPTRPEDVPVMAGVATVLSYRHIPYVVSPTYKL